jgi:hypothetical protein
MTIKFLKECELEVIESVDDDDNVESTMETFHVNDTFDVDRYGDEEDGSDQNRWDLQFGNGSCILGVPRILFEVIKP